MLSTAVFAFEVGVTSSSLYYLIMGEKYIPSALLRILRLFWTFCGYTCPRFLLPLLAELSSLLPSFDPTAHYLGADILSFAFSSVRLKLKSVVSSWPAGSGLLSMCAH